MEALLFLGCVVTSGLAGLSLYEAVRRPVPLLRRANRCRSHVSVRRHRPQVVVYDQHDEVPA